MINRAQASDYQGALSLIMRVENSEIPKPASDMRKAQHPDSREVSCTAEFQRVETGLKLKWFWFCFVCQSCHCI